MFRRSLAIAAASALLLVLTVLIALWASAVPTAVALVLTVVLAVLVAASVLGARRPMSTVMARRRAAREQLAGIEQRLGRLEGTWAATTTDAADPEAATAPLPPRDRAGDAEGLRVAEARIGELMHARRAQEAWAHEIESTLHAHRHELSELAATTQERRARDHARMAAIERSLYDHVLRTGTAPASVLDGSQVRQLADRFARSSDYLRVKPLLDTSDVLAQMEDARLVAALKSYRRLGYLRAQSLVAEELLTRGGCGLQTERLEAMREELEFFEDPLRAAIPVLPEETGIHDPAGPVVHLVGKTLPETQSGYTLRTHYTVRAQQRRGIEAVVLCQAGAPGGDPERTVEHVVEGVRCLVAGGPARYETTYGEWLRRTVRSSAVEVRRLRPSVLHAHSDFLNALVALSLGRAFSIPVVYESRGFWEESWLSRTLAASDLPPGELLDVHGMPEAYTLRQRAEVLVRARADANLTLGRTMADHIEELAGPEGLMSGPIRLVPNGIETGAFAAVGRDEELARSLGIARDEVVVGCVSSIVEYEGIDLLLEAVDRLGRRAGPRIRLLVVGDGPCLAALKDRAQELDVPAVFPGRIPHDDVLRYYGLLDIFVVPRRASAVSRLVTPLKPFEALATGRALVVSDVEALKEIAEDSGGAVAQFRAGDAADLARALEELVADPDRRADMGRRGTEWVAKERTWDANAEVYAQTYRDLGAAITPR